MPFEQVHTEKQGFDMPEMWRSSQGKPVILTSITAQALNQVC